MRLLRLYLVGMSPSTCPVALAAAREAFPGAKVAEVGSMEEVGLGSEAPDLELVVLAEPDTSSAAHAIQALDSDGLPRWAVVILGRDMGEFAETLSPEHWDPPLIARVFRSAVQQHQLLRENLRLQGDLRTIARRITHDLNTSVGCIFTSAQVLKAVMLPDEKGPNEAMVQNIENSSTEIAQIIERVSFVLRASADPHLPEPVRMGEVVANVLLELDADIKGVEATVALPATWPAVRGVHQWLHVIWWNLLKNALTHGGARPQVQLMWRVEEDALRFAVVDRGAAISASIKAGLFRPFDQLHMMPARGIGLSLVQRLVALQGGHCGYKRLDGSSSSFYFTLPAEDTRRLRREQGSFDGRKQVSLKDVADGSCEDLPHSGATGLTAGPLEDAMDVANPAQPVG
jgi:signal transduction histidine kinase